MRILKLMRLLYLNGSSVQGQRLPVLQRRSLVKRFAGDAQRAPASLLTRASIPDAIDWVCFDPSLNCIT